MADTQSSKTKPPFVRSKLFLFLIPLLQFAYAAMVKFGCSLGMVDNFECRVAIPSFFLGSFISLIIIVLILRPLRVTAKAKGTLLACIVIPILLFQLPSWLPYSLELKYLDGMTVESCATNTSVLPWGKRYINSNVCYDHFNMCEKISGGDSELRCFQRAKKFTKYSDCLILKDTYNVHQCQLKLAKKNGDSICSNPELSDLCASEIRNR